MSDLLLKSLRKFYANEYNFYQLYKVINTNSSISLRLVDWFVTNYSKKYNIIYLLDKEKNEITCDVSGNSVIQINVFQAYKSQLKAFSKKRFDPFCRRERLDFVCNEKLFNTTIGQLNFFKWAIANRVIDYIEMNKEIIEDDMNTSLKVTKETGKKNKNGRKSRQELSKSALRGLNRNKLSVCIRFD